MSGLRWTYLSLVAGVVLQLAYQAVINRLLDPTAFGLLTAALLIIRFSKFFADMGVGRALVQKSELDEEDVRASFASSLLLGLGAYALVWVTAPAVASFFGQTEATGADVVPVIRVTALSLVLTALGTTSQSLLQREMRFAELGAQELVSYTAGFLFVGIGLAAAGAGVWSLVAAQLVQAATATALTYARARHSLRPLLAWRRLRPLYSFGSRASVISLVDYLASNLDTIAVGRYFNTALLGQYNRAYYLTTFPTRQLTTSISKVLFPGFSRIQADTARTRRAYLGALSVAAVLLLPVCAGMAVAAQEFVLTLLGPQWGEAADLVPLLTIAAGLNVLSHFPGVVSEARAELNKKLALQVAGLVVLFGFLLLARDHGLWAFALALAASKAVKHLLYIVLMHNTLGVTAAQTVRAYAPALFAAGVVAGFVAAGRLGAVSGGVPVAVVLLIEIAAGGVGLLVALRTPPLRGVRREIRDRLKRSGLLRERGLPDRIAGVVLGRR